MNAYHLDILFTGFPGKTTTHGGLGWSTVVLLRRGDEAVLVDSGPPAYLAPLHERLDALGVAPAQVTHILATHLHWDHIGNFTMFPNARVVVGRRELSWASEQPAGTPLIADLHVRRLAESLDRVELVDEGDEPLPGVRVLEVPGHTPGHLAFTAETDSGRIVFAGDAVKNRYELATGIVDSSVDFAASAASVDRLRGIMRVEGMTMVPGHDVPLALVNGRVSLLDEQRATFSVFLSTEAGESPRTIV